MPFGDTQQSKYPAIAAPLDTRIDRRRRSCNTCISELHDVASLHNLVCYTVQVIGGALSTSIGTEVRSFERRRPSMAGNVTQLSLVPAFLPPFPGLGSPPPAPNLSGAVPQLVAASRLTSGVTFERVQAFSLVAQSKGFLSSFFFSELSNLHF